MMVLQTAEYDDTVAWTAAMNARLPRLRTAKPFNLGRRRKVLHGWFIADFCAPGK